MRVGDIMTKLLKPNWHSDECYICYDTFGVKCPRLTPNTCRHSVCIDCWKKSVAAFGENCQYCKAATPLLNLKKCKLLTPFKTAAGEWIWRFHELVQPRIFQDQHQKLLNDMTGLKEDHKLTPRYNKLFICEMKERDDEYRDRVGVGSGEHVGGPCRRAHGKAASKTFLHRMREKDRLYKLRICN